MEEITKHKIRKSNFELLRIICMFFILIHHFYLNNFEFDYANITMNQQIVQFLSTFGKVGVNIFILITGYFMIDSKFNIRKFVKIILEVLFYSYIILLIIFISGNLNVSVKDCVKCLLPISYNEYWFITCYIILYVLSDFINKFLNSISKKEWRALILILSIIWVLIPTFINGKFEYSGLDWFIYLYIIGGYLKKNLINKISLKKLIVILIIFLTLSFTSIFILNKLYNKLHFKPIHFAMPENQLICVSISIILFLIFEKINIKEIKLVNKMASCVFGVYLIHCQILARDIIWYDILNVKAFQNSNFIILYQLFCSLAIFIICVIIDLIRQNTFEKLLLKLYDKKIYKKIKE